MNNFYYAMTLAETLYDVQMQDDDFEEIALVAWNQIGNKRYRLYKYTTCVNKEDYSVELPCNADIIEAVTTNFEDFQHVSNTHERSLPGSFSTEAFIEGRKAFKNPLYISGKYIPFTRSGNTLYFSDYSGPVNILYKGIELDENGLPEINDKEALAIATYCAYIAKFKEGLRTNNKISVQMAENLRIDWTKKCDAARVPENVSQNEMDEILDAKNSWDRKIYTRSYKIIK